MASSTTSPTDSTMASMESTLMENPARYITKKAPIRETGITIQGTNVDVYKRQFLRNAEVASKGVLPFCQDTGTAIIHGEKGQQVWTGYSDEEALSLGVYKTYTEANLRYSQNAPLNMYDEVNTKCNLPAQIDIEATEGMEYEFLCVTKGAGSANKT